MKAFFRLILSQVNAPQSEDSAWCPTGKAPIIGLHLPWPGKTSVLTRQKLQVLQGQEGTRLWDHSRWVQLVTIPSKLTIGQNSYPCIIKKPLLSCSGL